MLVPLVIAALAAFPQEGVVELVWNPAPGMLLERCIEFEVRGSFTGVDGRPDEIDLFDHPLVSIVGRMRVRDELLRVGSGRPLELVRELCELRTEWNGLVECVAEPGLAARAMRYTWDAESGTYERAWTHPRPRGLPVPALGEDLDLRVLLADGPVRIGAVWHVPVRRAAALLAPAGRLHLGDELARGWGLEDLARAFDIERVQRIRDGEVECRLAKVEAGLAVVEFGWSWWGTIDPLLTPEHDAWIAHYLSESVSLDLDARAWGRLWWDPQAGHARALELEAELSGRLGPSGETFGLPIRARGTWYVAIEPR